MKVRSWYGLTGEIEVENELWHLVRVGGVALKHPPIINLLLRRGLPREDRLYLSFLHEFGHLQTLLVALIHGTLMLFARRRHGRGSLRSLTWKWQALIAHQAVWELAAESYTAYYARPRYRQIYRRYPNPLGRSIFWIGMLGLVVYFTQRAVNS